ncbi:hypothetical protein ACJJTC_015836 [Scirpophaga incertulas]
MSIRDWKLGDIATAKISLKCYTKVQVVIDEKGLFFDDKVLAISGNKNGSITTSEELCYYVEITRTKERLWVPYTTLRLASRSRPFYGPADKIVKLKQDKNKIPKKRKIKEDLTVPLDVKITNQKEPDLNITYDTLHIPLKQGKRENAFKEFIRRGKEMLFDHYFKLMQNSVNRDENDMHYLLHVNASTEDKFEMVTREVATLKEIENYLHQCWRYNYVCKQIDSIKVAENFNTLEKNLALLHAPWCLVCGKKEKLRECPNCPACFHLACRREWLITIVHRKCPPKNPPKPVTLIKKILSSTRIMSSVCKQKEIIDLCPSCMWGPKVGYEDIVWHKLGTCSWWPARVLAPGSVPSCLLTRKHAPQQWALQYYGTLNYSWGDSNRMCLFLPTHTEALTEGRDPTLQNAVLDACDAYITIYLK